jgi:N-acetylmuramoyl-L-alanine amidase
MFLECHPPKGGAAEGFLSECLANPGEWKMYKDRSAVAIRFDHVKPEVRKRMLLAIFNQDYVDSDGWRHTAVSDLEKPDELKSICGWVTGKPGSFRTVLTDKRNSAYTGGLPKGSQILIPRALLSTAMREPTQKQTLPEENSEENRDGGGSAPVAPETAPQNQEESSTDLDEIANELTYGSDGKGAFAIYHLKQGEALYTAVVVRFTDIHENVDILAACDVVQERSGIKNVHGMKTGQRILIPMDMLSDRYRPKGSEQRKEYEESINEAKRLRKEQVHTKGLDGVIVVIDPGHGGRDQGCADESKGLFEDELNYDVACRVKRLLETQTRAKVYITEIDLSQKYETTDKTRFTHDTDEEILTTPHYDNQDAKISVNLRWYLANEYYRDEVKKGADPRKMVFTSFHTNSLNASLRGAMIYIPGAKDRRNSEEPGGGIYSQFKEARGHRTATTSLVERKRDEALSRIFAEDISSILAKRGVKRNTQGDVIRSQIRQEGGKVYVPAVLRNTLVPTKVLIEMANIGNPTDCKCLANPDWRQSFAEAYVEALKTYFGS